jgi:excisionase family DNA binding protein
VATLAGSLTSEQPAAEPWRLYDVEEAAAALGRSTRWVRERVKRGDLPFIKLDGGALAFELEELQAFARARSVSADDGPALAPRLQPTRDPARAAGSGNGRQAGNRRVSRG